MDLKELKEKYNLLIDKNEKLKKLKKKLTKLEQRKTIIEYKQIKETLSKENILTREQIIDSLFPSNVTKNIKSNIYVYEGAYTYNREFDARSDYMCSEVEKADYLLYKNLVNVIDSKRIKPSEFNSFKEKYIIIDFKESHKNDYKYYEIRRLYFEKMLNDLSEKEILEFFKEYSMIFGIRCISIPEKYNNKKKVLKKG